MGGAGLYSRVAFINASGRGNTRKCCDVVRTKFSVAG